MFNGRKIIAVCIPKAYEDTSFRYLGALNDYAVKKGYTLFVYQTCRALFGSSQHDSGENYVFELIDYDIIDGLILFSELIKDNELVDRIARNALKHHIPVIAVERPIEGCVNLRFDYGDCFEKIVRHIIVDHKLTKVNFIAGMKNNSFSEERLNIYKKVLEEQGIPYEPERVGYGEFWAYPTMDVMREFLAEGKELPEAIICSNDTMAIVACRMLSEKGYTIPDDIIVSGFDGIEDEQYNTPRLTTCRNNHGEMAQRVIDVIDDASNGKPVPEEIVIGFEMVRSQSCGCTAKKASDAAEMLLNMHDRLDGYQSRVSNMNDMMALINKARKPELMQEGFAAMEMFNDTYCCLNSDALDPKAGVVEVEREEPFTDEMIMAFRGNFHFKGVGSEVVRFNRKDIAPDFDKYIDMELPVVFSTLHYLNIPIGYIIVNPTVFINFYERIPQVAETFGNGFGNVRMYTAMEKMFIHDPLTELYNRRGFYRLIQPAFENAFRKKDPVVAIVSADLDGLKYINDTFGHSEGDNAIKIAAKALAHAAENGEICARFGGDEFVVAGVIEMDADEYSEGFKSRFYRYIENYNSTSGKPYKVAASIGITCCTPVGETVDELIKMSDDLMYADKATRKIVRSSPRK